MNHFKTPRAVGPLLAIAAGLGLGFSSAGFAAEAAKPATDATRAANAAVRDFLPFNDERDIDDATRGFVAKPDSLVIRNEAGDVVWDMDSYTKYIGLDKPAPDTVNPSLWRNAQLNVQYGLFQVTDNIWQVRGYDIANITYVKGDTGWIVLDPAISAETAKASYDLVTEELGERPVVGVIYSHSHVDHYGGVRGIVKQADVDAGKVEILAPEGFMEHAVSELVLAGNAMSRRAIFMYGALLPRDATGGVNAGLGQTNSTGTITLMQPTRSISETGTEVVIDGVRMVFQMTPGTEAPAEMNTWFPDMNAMWMAENTTNTMHNILTLRGAQVRDALNWAKYLNETIELYGDQVQVKFQSHHWPMWENERVVDYWKKQRDLYKYMHDQVVNLLNKGYTGEEISEMIELPDELAKFWPNRGYYGTLRHNARAIYQRYMGWYDGNPSSLDNLPPEPAAKKYVEYMGGAASIIERARADYDKGEYRWVAEALKHVVYAEPDNQAAKNLLADAYEQLGYQAEAGTWRSVYLQGAYELRNGTPSAGGVNSASPDTIREMSPEMLFDYLAVRLNGPKAAGKQMSFNIAFTDLDKRYGLTLENAVLNYGKPVEEADATLTLAKSTLDKVQLGETTFDEAVKSGDVKIEGDAASFQSFLGLLDDFPFWFNIVTP
ncbi:alkyl sulfatase dimerization domain-containing protein [Halopseudomonas maritima]|uniref:alkyl sulfatase dimerization domain-containing protein n=1 Tax=Halopseudomonas maritima TaxID=2918528 RepID=UPI001EEA2BFF|nr:alkyl sulfatase dimerization domain-containing protein [Halopseudomonas maritima]UJJ32402.1 MBL fold metallo-hydrolase [Halopseudomonas maritima]